MPVIWRSNTFNKFSVRPMPPARLNAATEFHISGVGHRLGAKAVFLRFLVVEHRSAHLAEHLRHQHRLELLGETLDLLTLGVGSLRRIERDSLVCAVVDVFDAHPLASVPDPYP